MQCDMLGTCLVGIDVHCHGAPERCLAGAAPTLRADLVMHLKLQVRVRLFGEGAQSRGESSAPYETGAPKEPGNEQSAQHAIPESGWFRMA